MFIWYVNVRWWFHRKRKEWLPELSLSFHWLETGVPLQKDLCSAVKNSQFESGGTQFKNNIHQPSHFDLGPIPFINSVIIFKHSCRHQICLISYIQQTCIYAHVHSCPIICHYYCLIYTATHLTVHLFISKAVGQIRLVSINKKIWKIIPQIFFSHYFNNIQSCHRLSTRRLQGWRR